MRLWRGGPAALALLVLLAALGAVVWRQSRALEASKALAAARLERDAVEGEITLLLERIQRLESRGRVLQMVKERMGMRVPRAEEIVILPATFTCTGSPGECPR